LRLACLISAGATSCCLLVLAASCGKKSTPPGPKSYTWTVDVSAGIDGHPPTGTYEVTEGMMVNYGYRILDDYTDFCVQLDGDTVAPTDSFVMNSDHTLSATCQLKVLWKFHCDQAIYYSSPAVGDDGTIYFGSGMYLGPPYSQWRPGTLYALNPDGTLQWSHDIGNAVYSPVIGNDGTIFVQDHQNYVYAFDPGGGLKWTYSDCSRFHRDMGMSTPAIGPDGTVYIGADGIHAVDPQTGQRLWHFTHNKPACECIASPVIGPDGTIYATICEDSLFAVNPDGTRRWAFGFTRDYEMTFDSPAIDEQGVLYVGVEGGWDGSTLQSNVYAINPNGTLRWKYPVDGGRFVRASPVIGPTGTIYVATKAGGAELDARLIALSPTGIRLWYYSLERVGADIYCTPSIGADGLIYFGAESTLLYALNPDGTLNWKFQTYGNNWSSPAILPTGTLLLGTLWGGFYEGYLVAYKTTSHGYAAAPWPRFHHDNKNTGRYGAH